MKPEGALALPDSILADLYALWSEDTWCAGWISGGESEFVPWILNYEEDDPLDDYKQESIVEIRRQLEKLVQEEEE